jgi:hypothetical protein
MNSLVLTGEGAAVLPVLTRRDDDLLRLYLIEGNAVVLERWRLAFLQVPCSFQQYPPQVDDGIIGGAKVLPCGVAKGAHTLRDRVVLLAYG